MLWQAGPAPMVLSGSVAALSLLLLLTLVPGTFSAAHAAALTAAASGLAALHMALRAISRRAPAREVHRLRAVGEHLAARIEELQDLQWEISEREVRYRDLLDTQPDMVVRIDGDGRLNYANRAYYRTFGADADTAIGRPLHLDVIEGEAVPLLVSAVAGKSAVASSRVSTVAGPRWFSWQSQVASVPAGGALEIQLVGRDVTDARRAEAELTEARDQADAANRAKSRFLAAMSHEIRTPMNGILGMASLLSETSQTAEQQSYVKAIDQSARTLLALIDEILDFSKVEAGKMVLVESTFSLSECVGAAVELLSPRAYEKRLELAWTIDRRVPARIVGDESRIRQVLLNLLSNAVKFTDSGGVVVHARLADTASSSRPGALALSLSVSDTGIGLSTEDMKGLFAEFEQSDAAVRRREGGTGLGLAISKRIARAMGGDIHCTSSPGKGATFTFEFVAANAGDIADCAGSERWTKSPGNEDLHVLLAVEARIERAMLASVLDQAGIRHLAVAPEDARGAIAAAARASRPFNRIVVEVGGDAEEAGRLLTDARAAAPPANVLGLVMVNVLARAALAAYRAAGFGAYLVRPVRPSALLQQLGLRDELATAVLTPAIQFPIDLPEAAVDARKPRPRVLVAEDNEINALLARKMIESAGCDVEIVRDGREAIGLAERWVAGGVPVADLVLMDIFMPHVDGVEAARAIKALFARSGPFTSCCPPIVALTANAFPEDRERYVASGMDDYLAKPFDRTDLESILARWLKRDAAPLAPAC